MCSTEIRMCLFTLLVLCGIGLLVISKFMPGDNDTIVVKPVSTVNEERKLSQVYQTKSINTTDSINNSPQTNVAWSETNTDLVDITESVNLNPPTNVAGSETNADPIDITESVNVTASENDDTLSSPANELITPAVAELDERTPPVDKRMYGIELYNVSDVDTADQNIYCASIWNGPAFKLCVNNKDIDDMPGSPIDGRLWDSELTWLLQRVLKQNTHFTLLDIGAELGYLSLLAASLGHHAVAVEPSDQHLRKFAKSIHLNGFQDQITVFRNAVSDDRRIEHIDGYEWIEDAPRLLSDVETAFSTDTIATSTILLDDLAVFISTKYVILKLNMDGHECRAMEHVDWLFDTFQVLLIFTEWGIMTRQKNEHGSACPPESIQQTTRMLISRGFVPYTFPNQQIDPRNSVDWPYMDVYWWLEQ